MRNIKLSIRYDGTRYGGWQSQSNSNTIQDEIVRALKKITGEKVNLIGSGRTDAGVHAMGQVANFKTRSRIPLDRLQMALNSHLPKDIVVWRVENAVAKFDSQKNAKSKLYRYTISNGNFVDPFIRHFAAKYFYRLNIDSMKKAAGYLLGRHNLKSFTAKDGGYDGNKDYVRRIKKIKIEKSGNLVYIDIEADGFLYNMARNIVGTLIEAGRGKIKTGAMRDILSKKDRAFCGPTAPAKGLCLMKVRY